MMGPREELLKNNMEECSLAAIADKMTEGDWKNADTGSDKKANS